MSRPWGFVFVTGWILIVWIAGFIKTDQYNHKHCRTVDSALSGIIVGEYGPASARSIKVQDSTGTRIFSFAVAEVIYTRVIAEDGPIQYGDSIFKNAHDPSVLIKRGVDLWIYKLPCDRNWFNSLNEL